MKRKLFRPERALKTALVYLLVLLVSFLFAFPCVWLVLSAFNAEGDLLTLKRLLPRDVQPGYLPPPLYRDQQVRLSAVVRQHLLRGGGELRHFDLPRHRSRLHHLPLPLQEPEGAHEGDAHFGHLPQLHEHDGALRHHDAAAPHQQFMGARPLIQQRLGDGIFGAEGIFRYHPRHHLRRRTRWTARAISASLSPSRFPLSKPMIVYTALTAFVWPWADFMLPSMLLVDKSSWTVAVGLNSLDDSEFSVFAAGSMFCGGAHHRAVCGALQVPHRGRLRRRRQGMTSPSARGGAPPPSLRRVQIS